MKDLEARINFDKSCRVCLAEEKNMKSLFCVEQILENAIQLSDILMSCSSIRIEKDEGLPELICIKCSEQANIAYLFRKLCESSDCTLRELSKQFGIQRGDVIQNKEHELSEDILLEDEDSLIQNELESNFCNIPSKNVSVLTYADSEQIDELQEPHNEQDKNSQLHPCENCTNGFSSKKELSLHIRSYHQQLNNTTKHTKKNLPTTCDICNKTFRFHSNLERHKLVHTGEKPYLCNVCGKSFAQFSALKIHHFTHTGEKPYKCQICTQCFSAPGTLATHLRTHTGERPHVCKICGKQFPQAGYLSSHIRTHTGEKPTECHICGQKFNQSGRLTIHMRIHSGEKPYKCEVCKRSFAIKGTLKKHMRTHSGERPYSCKTCGQSFAQNGTLTTHMKVHRPKAN